MNFTFGAEIEAVDFNRNHITLPRGCTWAKKEVTLVNSNGIAVDSTGKTENYWGGEINTPPTNDIDEFIDIIAAVFKVLKLYKANINYRCNFQIHISIPTYINWNEDNKLNFLKKVQKWAFENWEEVLMVTMGKTQFEKLPEYPYSFWRHTIERPLADYKHKALMEAKTLKEFQNGFFLSKTGKHAFQTFQRQYINTHSYFKYGTIEFRNFWATLDIEEAMNVFALCFRIMKAIQYDYIRDEWGLLKESYSTDGTHISPLLPQPLPFDLKLEEGFQATKVKKP